MIPKMEESPLLARYYSRHFPVNEISEFLELSPNREFSFVINNRTFIRYISFPDAEQFKKFLIKKVPARIDLGAVYKSRPELGSEMYVDKKELVFDIDLTDFKRNCCEGKNICDLCFTLIKCSGELMDYILRVKFGFKNILLVFSGGRGIHVWVSDKEAMYMDDKERAGICEYINNHKKYKVDENRGHQIKETNKDEQKILEILTSYDYYFTDQKLDIEISEKTLFEYLYVKLDLRVTADTKHLLKSPFSVHPTSGNVSVPITLEMLRKMKVSDLPSLEDVIEDEDKFYVFVNVLRSHILEKASNK